MPFTQSLEVLEAPHTTVLQSATVAALYICYFHIIKSFTFKAFLKFREYKNFTGSYIW
jgi:hypothetical protein